VNLVFLRACCIFVGSKSDELDYHMTTNASSSGEIREVCNNYGQRPIPQCPYGTRLKFQFLKINNGRVVKENPCITYEGTLTLV
jgi:hypothetical protein